MKTICFSLAIMFLGEVHGDPSIKQLPPSCNGYIENKGQMMDQNNLPNPECLYLYNSGGLHVQLKKNSFSYEVWQKTAKCENQNVNAVTSLNPRLPLLNPGYGWQVHRVDVFFLNANKNPNIIASEVAPDFTNYYTTGTPESGVVNVHSYKKVLYRNIYPNIDVEFVLDDQQQDGTPIEVGVKYNFLVHPGGNVQNIKMQFDGANNTSLTRGGHLIIETAFGPIDESIPISYQLDNNNQQQAIASNFKLEGRADIYGISVGNYDASKTLVIDPWATYYGGSGNDDGYAIAVDGSGNILGTGETSSSSGIATSGAYQTSAGGNTDAFIVKFNGSGARQWATYYGGSAYDMGYGIAIDNSGNILITGETHSSSGMATSGAYQSSYGGGTSEAYIAKFNASGARQWATYYGGTSSERGNKIAADGNGNLVITGLTSSTSGIATSGAYQTSYGGGNLDAFIAKFNASGARQWATYYGASGLEYGTGISVDASGNIVITGSTTSTSGIATSGTHQTSFGGGTYDAFITKFNASGALQSATYYGGNGDDNSTGIAADASGNIVITGRTTSTSGMATGGAYQTGYGGGTYDAFTAKFNASGARQWATYYGGSGEDNGFQIAADSNGNIVIIGYTTSLSGIATSGAYQTSYGGGTYDALIAKFDASGARQWATYYGGSGGEWGYGIAVDNSGNFVVTGNTASTSGIATSGSHQTSAGGGDDAFVALFTAGGGLPVKLISFSAKQVSNKEVHCNWSTATETNNNYFEVERSMAAEPEIAESWSVIGKVPGEGNSIHITTYGFTDALTSVPPSGAVLYYRLKQVDFDGNFAYSNVVAVHTGAPPADEIVVFPNPANGSVTIRSSFPVRQLEIYDVDGRKVHCEGSLAQEVHSIENLAPGIYYVRMTTEAGTNVKKIVVR